jgi:glutaredoxin-like protein NrdH
MSYEERIMKIEGEDKGKIFVFTLSTCVWCVKTKQLLKDLGVAHEYIDVDLVMGDAKEKLMSDFGQYAANVAYPTIVINDGQEIINGFEETRLKELFENGK